MSTELVTWLATTELGMLPADVLAAIASELEVFVVPAGSKVTIEDTPATKLYILEAGRAERYRRQRAGLMWASGLLPGAVVNLSALQRSQPTDSRVVAVTECRFQTLAAPKWQALVARYPQISAAYTARLAGKLEQLEGEIAYERDRQAALRTYLVPQAKRGIIGESRYAVKLRQQIRAAAADDLAVLISGEPGLEKDNIAALIHFGSPRRQQPIISLNSGLLTANGAELFGRVGGKPGLLEWLGEGTLVLNDVQELPPELVPQIETLITEGNYTPLAREGQNSLPPRPSSARIILISESAQPTFNKAIEHQIKVPALRVRKTDLAAQINYYLNIICRQKKLSKPQITPEALRRLQAYDFPGNLQELKGMVERALLQSQGNKVLGEEVFWAQAAKKQQFRLNLLNAYPGLRRFLKSDWYPDRINYGFTAWVFPIVVLILLPPLKIANIILPSIYFGRGGGR